MTLHRTMLTALFASVCHRNPCSGNRSRPTTGIVLIAFCLAALVGCAKEEGVVTYNIPKKVPEQLLPGKERLVALMVPRDDKVWFFKIRGPQDSVDLIGDQFREFVTGITFDENDEPILKPLPEGWRRGGKKAMRFATVDINTDKKQLDFSISNLPAPAKLEGEPWNTYVVQNVNRWRKQVGLDDSADPFAGAEAVAIKASEQQAIWVDVVGQPDEGSGSSMMGPMSGMPPMMTGGPSGAPRGVGPRPEAGPKVESELDYDSPKNWEDRGAAGMREASFRLSAGEDSAEVTVITAGGDLRNNVARWMGQVAGGSPEDAAVDEMLASAEKFEVSGRPAQRFVIPGDASEGQKSIDATIVEIGEGRSKFIKMTGDPAIVADQSDAMRTFLKSLSF